MSVIVKVPAKQKPGFCSAGRIRVGIVVSLSVVEPFKLRYAPLNGIVSKNRKREDAADTIGGLRPHIQLVRV